MLNVINAKYIKDFKLNIQFDNGIVKNVDFAEYLKTEFREPFDYLKDINNFKNFELQNNTICWNNEVDIAPEFLIEME